MDEVGGGRRRRLACIGIVATLAATAWVTCAFALTTRTHTETIPAASKGSATAKCPKGTEVAFGGYHNSLNSAENPEVALRGLAATHSGRAWKDSVTNDSGTNSGNATAIAYCGKKRNLTKITKTKNVLVASGSTPPTNVTAKCPGNKRVAFGGIAGSFEPVFPTGPDIYVSQMRRTSQRSWRVSGLNLGSAAGPLTAIAYCGKVPKTTERSKSVTILNRGHQGSATARCHSGEKLRFGGFKADVTESNEFVLTNILKATSSRSWKAHAFNDNSSVQDNPGKLTSFAYCS